MSFASDFFKEVAEVAERLPAADVEAIVERLARARREGGRVFVLGVGGSAAAASHLVNDLRKLCGLEAYAPTDNVSELTARVNDEGWESCFREWLKGSRLAAGDVVFVFSVGGGNMERNISANLVRALELAREVGAGIVGVVGRDGGYTARVAEACVVVPTVNPEHVTPLTESFHAVVGHALVAHPALQTRAAKWESESQGDAGG